MELTETVKIGDSGISCSRWWLLDERLTMMVPEGFLAVPPREINTIFADFTLKPVVVLRNRDAVSLIFYKMDTPMENDQVAGALPVYKRSQYTSCHLSDGMLNGRAGLQIGYYDFVDNTGPVHMYAFYGIMAMDGRLLSIQWAAPNISGKYLEYRGVCRHIMKSITIEER